MGSKLAIGANLLSIAAVVIENLCSQRHTASWLNTSVINSAGIERHNGTDNGRRSRPVDWVVMLRGLLCTIF